MTSSAGGYTTLTRQDLRGFDTEATAMILEAMERGATARLSRKGHCIIRNADGETMSVARLLKLGNRGAQNTRAAFKRLFPPTEADTGSSRPTYRPPRDTRVTCPHPFPNGTCRHADSPHAPLRAPAAPPSFPVADVVGSEDTPATEEVEVKDQNACPLGDYPKPGQKATRRGLVAHTRIVHEGARPAAGRKEETEKVEPQKAKPKPQPPAPATSSDAQTLAHIRDLLGMSSREKELETALSAARARVDELESKLKLMKEALEL